MEYENREVVTGSKCDAEANLSVMGAITTIQDNVCSFFDLMGIDEIKMKNTFNCIWVYTKNKINFMGKLKFNESFFVKCFISEKTPIKIFVDVAFLNNNRNIVLYSKIEVCIIDLNLQHIRKITPDIIPDDIALTPSLLDVDFSRLDPDISTNIAGIVQVKSTNIDYCNHTNNIEYIRFILNTFSVKELIDKQLQTFEINYVNQTVENDTIEIYKDSNSQIQTFTLKSNGQVVTKCQLTFKN